jgi:CheY-like chemotaxis protein
MNGFAALRVIRRDPRVRDIPVIMISGNEQATEQFYAKRIGADDFMKKPFSRYEVFAHMESLVLAGKLPQLDAANPAQQEPITPAESQAIQGVANLSHEMISRMTPLEARSQLTLMGLQYFSQEQFSAAITRGDTLAVDLFIIGGGVEITA